MLHGIFVRSWQRPIIEVSQLLIHNRPNTSAALLLHHTTKSVSKHQQILRRAFARSGRFNTKNLTEGPTIQATPFDVAGGPIPLGNVAKALAFTGAFSSSCFLVATIMEYENTRSMMIKRAKQTTAFNWLRRRQQEVVDDWQIMKNNILKYWDGLAPGERVFLPICALNLLVFVMWRVPALKQTMITYFCSNPAGRAVCWPMFLSTLSHYSALHLFANMYVLHSFTNAAVMALGKEQFLAVYLSAGVIASCASILYKTATSQAGLSLGASGAIMAILGYVCTQYPDTKLSVLFLPMLTFSAASAIKVVMGIDLAGCIMGWRFFDHAAHLGGASFGVFWALMGPQVWQKRLPILTAYHDWRKTK